MTGAHRLRGQSLARWRAVHRRLPCVRRRQVPSPSQDRVEGRHSWKQTLCRCRCRPLPAWTASERGRPWVPAKGWPGLASSSKGRGCRLPRACPLRCGASRRATCLGATVGAACSCRCGGRTCTPSISKGGREGGREAREAHSALPVTTARLPVDSWTSYTGSCGNEVASENEESRESGRRGSHRLFALQRGGKDLGEGPGRVRGRRQHEAV